jgi:hypothetical protein
MVVSASATDPILARHSQDLSRKGRARMSEARQSGEEEPDHGEHPMRILA